MKREAQLKFRIKWLLIGFIIGLTLSGLTAIPLRQEIDWLARLIAAFPAVPEAVVQWVHRVQGGLSDGYGRYPFLAYGTDWLAFGHIMIALVFIGPLKDPVRNIWVIEWGMLACVLVIPMAHIFGPVRDIPFFHRLIDCSFGVVGIIPLWICRKYVLELAKIKKLNAEMQF